MVLKQTNRHTHFLLAVYPILVGQKKDAAAVVEPAPHILTRLSKGALAYSLHKTLFELLLNLTRWFRAAPRSKLFVMPGELKVGEAKAPI